jgi:uncharacterized protein (DUF58 family)
MSDTPAALPTMRETSATVVMDSTAQGNPRAALSSAKTAQRLPFQLSGTLLIPTPVLAWLLGALGVLACIGPLVARGWMLLGAIVVVVAALACYDAYRLWLARKELGLFLLPQEKGLRGREGQTIQIPLAIEGSALRRARNKVRVALMAASQESQIAVRAKNEAERLKLDHADLVASAATSSGTDRPLWPWNPEVVLLRRGLWPGPRAGIERQSRCGIWNLRQWFECPVPLRIDADLRPGRREMLRSPVYRALVASRETAWTGHGRDFERLREYQPGDNYAEISWKSTARRGKPVTRLFQWEQKQEVYFVVDQSLASAQRIGRSQTENNGGQAHAPRRLLDLAVETALVGATVALEMGDEFGLVTYADEPKSWLPAGSGQFHFHRFRDSLLNIEPLPTTPDYESLFSNIRLRLRRRAYLVLLADLAERSISNSLSRGIALLGSSHVILLTSILPVHARPAFSPAEDLRTDQDVYAALAGEKENQRLAALGRQLRQLGTELRFVPPGDFLRTAVEGYLESKREQRM